MKGAGTKADSNVVSLTEYRQERLGYEIGTAKCSACSYQWEYRVAPPAPDAFECPECRLIRGIRVGLYGPYDGASMFVCECGNSRMMLLSSHIFCEICGNYHELSDYLIS